MNLKEIIKIGLIVGGLALAVNGFANGNLPKVYADQLKSFQFNKEFSLIGYDTNQDGKEDAVFKYRIERIGTEDLGVLLKSYALDINKDGEYSNGEWFEYTFKVEGFNGEKEDPSEVNPLRLSTIDTKPPTCYLQDREGRFSLGYDTNWDHGKKIEFQYEKKEDGNIALIGCGVDLKEDNSIEFGEWIEHTPEE